MTETHAELVRHARRTIETHLLAADRDDPAHLEALQPTAEDYTALFGSRGPALQAAYSTLWEEGLPRVAPSRTRVRVAIAAAADITPGHPHFPGGFIDIAPTLPPASLWAAFKCTEPSKSTGMAFEGLCWRDGRWAWFPKVWRVLREL